MKPRDQKKIQLNCVDSMQIAKNKTLKFLAHRNMEQLDEELALEGIDNFKLGTPIRIIRSDN